MSATPVKALFVMAQAQSIYTLCTYGVVYTRIQSIRREEEKREGKGKRKGHAVEREGGKGWQMTSQARAVTSPPPRQNACPQAFACPGILEASFRNIHKVKSYRESNFLAFSPSSVYPGSKPAHKSSDHVER
jgi:hypothetical protein